MKPILIAATLTAFAIALALTKHHEPKP